MPRKDRTFTSNDMVRFYCEHLDEDEKRDIMFFFYIYIPLVSGLPTLLDVISNNIKDPRVRLILGLISRLWDTILKLKPDVLAFAVPDSIRQAVRACVFK